MHVSIYLLSPHQGSTTSIIDALFQFSLFLLWSQHWSNTFTTVHISALPTRPWGRASWSAAMFLLITWLTARCFRRNAANWQTGCSSPCNMKITLPDRVIGQTASWISRRQLATPTKHTTSYCETMFHDQWPSACWFFSNSSSLYKGSRVIKLTQAQTWDYVTTNQVGKL